MYIHIFFKHHRYRLMSGNSTTNISDHLPQFAIIPNMFGNTISNKSNIYERLEQI